MSRIHYLLISVAALSMIGCGSKIQSADDLITAHIKALGGYDNYKAIHTISYFTSYKEGGHESIHRFDRKRPDLIRITTNYDEEKGTFGYCEGFDGAAWEYSAKIPVRVIGEPSRALRNASTFEKPYIDYKLKGYEASYKGTANIKGYEVHHLELAKSDGLVYNYFFDVNTLMESISIGNAPYHGEGKSIEIFERSYDYRPVAGVLMAFKSQDRSGDKILSEREVHRIEVNKELPDDWFSPPLSQEQEMFKALREDMLNGQMGQLEARYTVYMDLANRNHRKKLENQVNTFGYELISYERYVDAIATFKLGIKHFPNSGNLHDSLGETYLVIGDTLNAIKFYQKSVSLDPGNEYGKKVLSQLK